MDELPEITEVERLTLKPGDILVIRYPGRVSPQDADRIKKVMRSRLDESIPILILDSGAAVEVIGEASDEDRIRAAMTEAQEHPGRIVTR